MKIKVIGSLTEKGRLPLSITEQGFVLAMDSKQTSEPVRLQYGEEKPIDLILEHLAGVRIGPEIWVYRNRIVEVQGSHDSSDELTIRIKHAVLKLDKEFEKVKREVQQFETFDKVASTPREPIPEDVRVYVWRRDEGRCVKCGGQQRLEYDHIIALANGGSNTERNIQLLCEKCNRSKGAGI